MKSTQLQFIDIECYHNFFELVAFGAGPENSKLIELYVEADITHDIIEKKRLLKLMDHNIFIIFKSGNTVHNDLIRLLNFISTKTLVAHNGDGYDFLLLELLEYRRKEYEYMTLDVILDELKDLSDMIINTHDVWIRDIHPTLKKAKETKWKRSFKGIDTLKSLFESVNRKSVKQTAINLKWHRIQDLPIEPNAIINVEDIADITDYCINDTLIVWAFFYHKIGEFKLKVKIEQRYGIAALNKNRSSLADAYLMQRYADETDQTIWQFKDNRTVRHKIHFKDLIWNKVHFQTDFFIAIHNEILNTTINADDTYSKEFIHNGTKYKIATGGLHSVDKPIVLTSTKSYIYRDADVNFWRLNWVNCWNNLRAISTTTDSEKKDVKVRKTNRLVNQQPSA